MVPGHSRCTLPAAAPVTALPAVEDAAARSGGGGGGGGGVSHGGCGGGSHGCRRERVLWCCGSKVRAEELGKVGRLLRSWANQVSFFSGNSVKGLF